MGIISVLVTNWNCFWKYHQGIIGHLVQASVQFGFICTCHIVNISLLRQEVVDLNLNFMSRPASFLIQLNYPGLVDVMWEFWSCHIWSISYDGMCSQKGGQLHSVRHLFSFGFRLSQSLWDLTDSSAVALLRCLPNFSDTIIITSNLAGSRLQ